MVLLDRLALFNIMVFGFLMDLDGSVFMVLPKQSC